MPSLIVEIEDNNIVIPALVETPYTGEVPVGMPVSTTALVDTGAQRTMVSRAIVDTLNAPILGYGTVLGVTGPAQTSIHELRIVIPTEFEQVGLDGSVSDELYFYWGVVNVMVLSHEVGEGIDVLLGMDMLVDFHMTMHKGRVIISS